MTRLIIAAAITPTLVVICDRVTSVDVDGDIYLQLAIRHSFNGRQGWVDVHLEYPSKNYLPGTEILVAGEDIRWCD